METEAMPYIHLHSNIPGVSIGAWDIEEDELYFLERVKLYEHEWARLAGIMHPQRRLEWLSSRLCLKELIQISNTVRVESLNTAAGKPYLSNDPHFISYTHSTRYSAAVASLTSEVGVDIEYRCRRRNLETRHLFMGESELDFFETQPSRELFLLIWSAKESLYKICGPGVTFKHDLCMDLENFSMDDNGILPAYVQRQDGVQRSYEVSYLVHPEFVLTYTADRL
jgi:phosphopantetheinyl transferase